MHIYALLRFLTGMGGIGCFMVCFVLVVEHVGFKVLLDADHGLLYFEFSRKPNADVGADHDWDYADAVG